jgi:NAD-reducing hydrogenase small subunit
MPTPPKPTLASDWLAGCAGCHMSLLDIDERLLAVLEQVDLLASPITDLKQPPESGVTVGVLEGAVANSATEEVAKRMRARCKILVALGDCAVFGGVPTMRNHGCPRSAMRRAYIETESTVDGKIPSDPELATMHEHVEAIDKVVHVDAYVPGCPPSAEAIYSALVDLLNGKLPKIPPEKLDWH